MTIFKHLKNQEELFDSHCHLTAPDFDADRDDVVKRSVTAGVGSIIDVGVDVESSKKAIENAKKYDGKVFAAVGIDMENLIPGSDLYKPGKSLADFTQDMKELEKLIVNNQGLVAAIGETGIDKFWLAKSLKEGKISQKDYDDSVQMQIELLQLHIELALRANLPLTIHSRGAERFTLERITDCIGEDNVHGIFHSFTGNYEDAYEILDCGFGLGITGIITFKNAEDLRGVFRKVLGKVSSDWSPSDFYERGVYFETDAPFLAPDGKRGQRNEPSNVKDIYEWMVKNL